MSPGKHISVIGQQHMYTADANMLFHSVLQSFGKGRGDNNNRSLLSTAIITPLLKQEYDYCLHAMHITQLGLIGYICDSASA